MSYKFLSLLAAASYVQGYWLMGMTDILTTERIDPIINDGSVATHVHSAVGGSNFRFSTNTSYLRQSECTSTPIEEDKSNYWFPHLYFQWANGSFSSVDGGVVIYYLFSDESGKTTAFPDDLRMISGDSTLRTYDESSHAQQAITYLCLDFKGKTSDKLTGLPTGSCPDGIRAQVNFPSCWNGKDTDSDDHKSHVAFPSGGPDSGTCDDPNFPVTLPRIFMEVYFATNTFGEHFSEAMKPEQPFVFSFGDRTGFGYHADFINGWAPNVLQGAVDKCHCNPYGDPQCCADAGIFTLKPAGTHCRLTKAVDEQAKGTLAVLPGNNPVVEEGQKVTMSLEENPPNMISPVYAYTGESSPESGSVVVGSGSSSPGSTGSSAGSYGSYGYGSSSSSASSSASEASAAPGTSDPVYIAVPGNSSDNADESEDEEDTPSCSRKTSKRRSMHRARHNRRFSSNAL